MTCDHAIGIEYERCGSNDGMLFGDGHSFCHRHENWSEDEDSASAFLFSFCPDCGKKLQIEWQTHRFATKDYKTTFKLVNP